MNKTKLKLFSAIFSILLILSLCSCSDNGTEDVSVNSEKSLIVEVDGKTFTIENAEGKTIQELLEDAKISLNDGDVLSLDTDVKLTDSMVVKILRKANVSIKNTITGTELTVVLKGATVSDAISAAGIELKENQTVNYETDEALKDGMNIVISEKKESETTEPYTEKSEDNYDSNNNSNSGNNNNSNSGYTPPAPVVTKPATTKPPQTTKPPVTKAPTTKPAPPTTSGKTIVSVEIYEDCDGSGHGVKVITYSDGTQEEVAF